MPPKLKSNEIISKLQKGEIKGIVVFDGVCNLCNWGVKFIDKRDKENKIMFAWAQDENMLEVLYKFNITKQSVLDEFAFLEYRPYNSNNKQNSISAYFTGKSEDNICVTRASTATLRVLNMMPLPWNICYMFILFPPFLRDLIYKLAAKTRYRIFGKTDECQKPRKSVYDKLL